MNTKSSLLRAAAVLCGSFAAITLSAQSSPAGQAGPMERLARALGTPNLGYTARNDERTDTMFEFVPTSETVDNWTKMYTVVASRVEAEHTGEETKATIERLRRVLAQKHVKMSAYDVRGEAAPVAYFKYAVDDEVDVGVVFSPVPGVVTIQQVASRHGGTITSHDVRIMKELGSL